MSETIILTKDPIKECAKYIKNNLDDILPFITNKGYHFQLRYDRAEYETISPKIINTLNKYSSFGEQPDEIKDDVWNRYITDHFWIITRDYIFNFIMPEAILVTTKCVFEYGHIEGHKDRVAFFDKSTYPRSFLKKYYDGKII